MTSDGRRLDVLTFGDLSFRLPVQYVFRVSSQRITHNFVMTLSNTYSTTQKRFIHTHISNEFGNDPIRIQGSPPSLY